MGSFRYYLALILVLTFPPALLYWFIVHPFARFWRRVGVQWTLTAVGSLIFLALVGLFSMRGRLLAVEFGTSYFLIVLGLICLVSAGAMFVRLKRHLRFRIQVGLPEIAAGRYPGRLLTRGIYSKIRHPRYVELSLGLLGYALIANYLATYLLFLLYLPVVYLVVLLEERELRERFGKAYEDYCRRVPRFIPRWRRP